MAGAATMPLGLIDSLASRPPEQDAPPAEDVTSLLLCVDGTRAHHIDYGGQNGPLAVGRCKKVGPDGKQCGFTKVLPTTFPSEMFAFNGVATAPASADEPEEGEESVAAPAGEPKGRMTQDVRLLRSKYRLAMGDLIRIRDELAETQGHLKHLEEALARSEAVRAQLEARPEPKKRKGGSGPRTKRNEVLRRTRGEVQLESEADARIWLDGWEWSAKNMVGLLERSDG